MFRMIPDFHGGLCHRLRHHPAMRAISPETSRRKSHPLLQGKPIKTNPPDTFLNMIENSNSTPVRLSHTPPRCARRAHRGGECEVCHRDWYSDEGYEIVAVEGRMTLHVVRSQPSDLVERGLISADHGKRFPFPSAAIINRVLSSRAAWLPWTPASWASFSSVSDREPRFITPPAHSADSAAARHIPWIVAD